MTLLHHSLLIQRDSKGDKTRNFANEKSIYDSWVLQQKREVSILEWRQKKIFFEKSSHDLQKLIESRNGSLRLF